MMQKTTEQLHPSWKEALFNEFESDYFVKLVRFLNEEHQQGHTVYPPEHQIFSAFNTTPLPNVKVVIMGQDPYHGPGQANGLCFSVSSGIKPPPSLNNIYKELNADLGIAIPSHGNLENWAANGVLLLNATLTVRAKTAGSHQKKGWEQFTDAVIRMLSEQKQDLVFILWGRFAQSKKTMIDTDKHHCLEAAHPSPFSAYNGFFGCQHFSQTNKILESKGIAPVEWVL